MGQIGRRGFEGALGEDFDPRCALACHSTSEPGLPDGGVAHVARELDFALPARGAPGTWDALPRDLRRVAGIGCTPCHGPGSLPEHRSSWVLLRSEVCATCHDAPPRYSILEAWQRGAMSRSDLDPATREPACAACHTTGGFLGSLGHLWRAVVPEGEAQPGPTGIACAACHASHREEVGPAQLRLMPLPDHLADHLASNLAGTASLELAAPGIRVCLPCHSAGPGDGLPRSSVAEILFGSSELPPVEVPHAAVPGTCLGCHGPHDFAVNSAVCLECHEEGPPPDPSEALQQRASVLLKRLGVERAGAHLQAAGKANIPGKARSRALRAAALVAADRAAGVHGAPRARALLEAAEAALGSPARDP